MGTLFPHKSISAMPAWEFWATPFSVGLSDEDAEMVAHGDPNQTSPEQLKRIQSAGYAARDKLRNAEYGTPYCGKPS